jgi:hypothetical protein
LKLNFRTATLLAAIGTGLSAIAWIAGFGISLAKGFRWGDALVSLPSFLFFLPLPVLLFVLYLENPRLRISRRLRWAALIIAILQGALVVAPGLYDWARLSSGTLGLIGLASPAAVFLFLIACFAHQDRRHDLRTDSRPLHLTAMAVTILLGFAIVLQIATFIATNAVLAARFHSQRHGLIPQYALQGVLFVAGPLAEFTAALIIYKGQSAC